MTAWPQKRHALTLALNHIASARWQLPCGPFRNQQYCTLKAIISNDWHSTSALEGEGWILNFGSVAEPSSEHSANRFVSDATGQFDDILCEQDCEKTSTSFIDMMEIAG